MDVEEEGMRFSPRKSKSKTCCCALGCKSYASKDETVRFHALPKAGLTKVEIVNKSNVKEMIDKREIWMRRLKISKNFIQARVCSLHFTKEDYDLSERHTDHAYLKKTAVPSVNLPGGILTNLTKKTNDLIRTQRKENRANKRKLDAEGEEEKEDKTKKGHFDDVSSSANIDTNNSVDDFIEEERNNGIIYRYDCGATNEIDDCLQEEQAGVFTKDFVQVKRFADKSVQVEFERYTNFIKNKKDLISMTGLCSFDLLYFLEDVVKTTVPNIMLHLCQNSSQLSIKDRIILTFIKLRHNMEYSLLSLLFRIYCEETCRLIFLRMLDILASGLQFAIRWPSKEEVLKNVPKDFEDYSNVRAVIDGIEVYIEKPKKVCCQSDSYSSHKSTYTVKFLTAVSLGGMITFISEAYPGKTSDKAIFEDCQFINKLESNDALIADKGFSIDNICVENNIQLIRPPSLRKKKQLSEDEPPLNVKIAEARIIEKLNQRLKIFKILGNRVPLYLVGRINKIFLIVAAILNLSLPFVKDNKLISR